MTLADVIALVLGVSLTAYAVLAGADFGAGILDLLAGRSSPDRALIAHTIGPLWEANHVWLIFSITILFSAFPPAFAALGTALPAPLTLAPVAIVLRGVAFALRSSPGASTPSQARLGRLFGTMSVTAPLLFGMVAGGLAQASTTRQRGPTGALAIPWTSVFSVIIGVLAVAVCALLAATFMALRLARAGDRAPAEHFRARGLRAAVTVLIFSVVALGVASWNAPAFSHRLTTAGLPLVVLGSSAAVVSIYALVRRRYALARGAVVTVGVSLVWGWLIAQSPHLIGTALTIRTAAATPPALAAVGIAGGMVLLTVTPAIYLLFRVSARPIPEVTP
jgi:cytochrome bd ubiquinol oxidase subunit II